MGKIGKYLCKALEEGKDGKAEGVGHQITSPEQRKRNIYTSHESSSKVSGMLWGLLNFETWLLSRCEI
jgi:hypothetical protein